MRFPTRTMVLMFLAVLAFGWMYWRTHAGAPAPAKTHHFEYVLIEGGGDS